MACSDQGDIVVEKAWIPEAPPTVSSLAGYLKINNNLPHSIILSGAESPSFEQIRLHQTVIDKETDYARMIEQGPITIRSGESFSFRPGGYHLMLLNPLQSVNSETTIPVSLIFENEYRVESSFEIRPFKLKLESD
jgi:copper(I)-binding protein